MNSTQCLLSSIVYRIDAGVLLFLKAQIDANSLLLFTKFVTPKNTKRTSQNVKVISYQSPSIF